MLVWLDINLGDQAAYEEEVKSFNRAREFLKEVGPSRGFEDSLEALDGDTIEILQEMYQSDPKWLARGPMRVTAPTPLRAGRIEIQLHDDVVKASENFRCLVTGEKGKGKESGKPLHFKNSRFHRIIKGFMCQGGDFVRGDGSGGESIFGKKFNDEKEGLKYKHDGPGVVGMANKGKNSNSSQFYITFAATPQLDGKYVVIGRVVSGLDVLKAIETRAAVDAEGAGPREEVIIADCGVC
eukprot:c1629_g1_i1.p1 GENE.c1629_g1_i1~~c1629_g1_i1.p1  ORF type:complete len:250 (+),score=56.62 c1629_g1_i1:36-752(+)